MYVADLNFIYGENLKGLSAIGNNDELCHKELWHMSYSLIKENVKDVGAWTAQHKVCGLQGMQWCVEGK